MTWMMGPSTLPIFLLALFAGVSAQSPAREPTIKLDYGKWQRDDFILKSPDHVNKQVMKEPPTFLSRLAINATKKGTSKVSLGNDKLTISQILANLPSSPTEPSPSKSAVAPNKKPVVINSVKNAKSKNSKPSPKKTQIVTENNVDGNSLVKATRIPISSNSIKTTISNGTETDDYLASESIFVTSDVESYQAPIARASSTEFAFVPSRATEGASSSSNVNIPDHSPSESVVVSSAVNKFNTPVRKPVGTPGKPGPDQNSKVLSVSLPKSIHDKEPQRNADVYTPRNPAVVTPYPLLRSGAANKLKEASISNSTKLQNGNTPTRKGDSRVASINRPLGETSQLINPNSKKNSVEKVPNRPKIMSIPKKTLSDGSALKTEDKSPVSQSTAEKSKSYTRATEKIKSLPNTLKSSNKAVVSKQSPAMNRTDVVKAQKDASNMLKSEKQVDSVVPSNKENNPKTLTKTGSTSKTLNAAKEVDKQEVKSGLTYNTQQSVKEVDKMKSTYSTNVSNIVGKSESNNSTQKVAKNSVKGKTSYTKNASIPVELTGSTSMSPKAVNQNLSNTRQIIQTLNYIKAQPFPNVYPSVAQSAREVSAKQKKQLLDKMHKWTQLIQSQERVRQEEYTNMLKDLQQIHQLEYNYKMQLNKPYMY